MTKALGERPNLEKVVKSFVRRQDAALRGTHLPTNEELIYGMHFYGGQLESDVREFAYRSAPVAGSLGLDLLQIALVELSMSATLEGVQSLPTIFGETSVRRRRFLDSVMLRRRIYLAAWGDSEPMAMLAMEVIGAALNQLHSRPTNSVAYVDLVFRAMELLASASASESFYPYLPGNRIWHHGDPDKNLIVSRGIRKSVTRLILDEEEKDSEVNHSSDLGVTPNPQPSEAAVDRRDHGVPGIVVLPKVGNIGTSEGKVAATYAKDLIERVVPFALGQQLALATSALIAEFPHAAFEIAQLTRSLVDGMPIRIKPTIIIGGPGSGKSYFCKRFLETLGLPFTFVPFAGISDSAVIGTARRYSTGEPSLPVSTIAAHLVANPGVVLDEVEKAGTGSQNGNALDSILPMLEGVTATAYHDPYLQASADISHLNWIMTANTLGPLSRPFRDRCRIIRFPAPSLDHLDAYVSNLLPQIVADRGQSVAMFRLDAVHRGSLQSWKDGSLRTLRKMLEAIVDEHDEYGRQRAH